MQMQKSRVNKILQISKIVHVPKSQWNEQNESGYALSYLDVIE